MKLKSYQSNSVEAAIRLARLELGEDTILMGSRENGPEAGSSASYEVTFAVQESESAVSGRSAEPAGTTRADGDGGEGAVSPAWLGLARRALRAVTSASADQGVAASAPRHASVPPVPVPQPHWREFLPGVSKPPVVPGSLSVAPKPPSLSADWAGLAADSPVETRAAAPDGRKPVNRETAPAPGRTECDNRIFAVIEDWAREVDCVRSLLSEPGSGATGARRQDAKPAEDPLCSSGIALLVSQGMCASAARNLIGEAIGKCAPPISLEKLQRHLEFSIEAGCRADATLGVSPSPTEPIVAALVGPAGSGKTATLCKLAVRFGLEAGRPVHFVNLDQKRLGASEQLASFADLLNAALTPIDDPGELAPAIRAAIGGARGSRAPLVLIDTPGYAPAERKQTQVLAASLSRIPTADIHLVVAASSSEAHLRRSVDAFTIFRPRKLLVTKLDESAEVGAIVGEALRCRLPISYFSAGQRIPEDLAPARIDRLANQLLQAF